ncbi:MAG: aminotransferase class V-fold PLP-dependent enzyme, partial [Filifactor alocis]|nr:aminotransferase class V-fold PLP-dependent enzyme [Filifactor alocis]
EEVHPDLLPDKYEAGTTNIVGLIGLLEGVRSILEFGLKKRWEIETSLGQRFFEKLSSLNGIEILGSQDYRTKPPVFSLNFKNFDNADISYLLAQRYQIDNRCGLHCAPRAHQSYGTFPQGSVRLSLSHFTTEEELDYVIGALRELTK